jgi:SAM-dependent methyltransferase
METFESQWRARFERFARNHKADHLISGWSQKGLQRRLALFGELLSRQQLTNSARILDLGCGGGTYVRFLAAQGHWVVGFDYSLPSLYRALDADPERRGHYAGGEAYHLPFRDEAFDLIVSVGVLQSLESPARALDEMVRVLRPKGLLIVEFLNACEVVAIMKAVADWITGRPSRVLTYSPFHVSQWFAQRGLRIVRRDGVYLPPRQLPGLGKLLELRGVVEFLEKIPGLSLGGAHAFLLTGEKETR